MISIRNSTNTPAEAAAKFTAAKEAINPNGGLAALFTAAISQLHRYVNNNIQVDQNNARNSLFTRVESKNGVVAMLGANARHAPYVGYQKKRSSKQFMRHAKDAEVPNVLEWLGDEVVVKIEENFD